MKKSLIFSILISAAILLPACTCCKNTGAAQQSPSVTHKLPIEGVTALPMAHSHNDYEHAVPLFDALSYGFVRIEPDIYILPKDEVEHPNPKGLVDQEYKKDFVIMVGHNYNEYKGTLYDLYIKDIEQQLGPGRFVFSGYDKPILFMIDMKTHGPGSIEFMNEYLAQYSNVFNDYNAKVQDRPVTVFLSGYNDNDVTQKDIDYLLTTPHRYVGIDGRVDKPLLGQNEHPELFPLISNAWNNRSEETLAKNIKDAHDKGQMIRFWGIDDKPATWDKCYKAGIDVISTDDHKGVRDYLLKQMSEKK